MIACDCVTSRRAEKPITTENLLKFCYRYDYRQNWITQLQCPKKEWGMVSSKTATGDTLVIEINVVIAGFS